VTAADGTTTSSPYTVTVNLSSDTNIQDTVADGGTWVMAVSNAPGFLSVTVANAATVDNLMSNIESTDGSRQAYGVYSASDTGYTNPVGYIYPLVTGEVLRVMAQDGSTAIYTITVAPAYTYTVTYNDNGSTGGTVPFDSTGYLVDAPATVSDPGNLTKIGYNFAGWTKNSDGSGTLYSAGDTFAITADTTLYAKWTSWISHTDYGTVTNYPAQTFTGVPFGTTAGQLKGGLLPPYDSPQTYTVTDSNGAPVDNATALVTGDLLVVTGADGITKTPFEITVTPSNDVLIEPSNWGAGMGVTVDNDAHTITISTPYGTELTVTGLRIGLAATDGSTQFYLVYQPDDTTMASDSDSVLDQDSLIVRAADGTLSPRYRITVTHY